MNFELINNLITDYVLIVEVLLLRLQEKIIEHNDKIYLDREIFIDLLSKKDFISPQQKMKIWRSLGWISCDKDRSRYTKKLELRKKLLEKLL